MRHSRALCQCLPIGMGKNRIASCERRGDRVALGTTLVCQQGRSRKSPTTEAKPNVSELSPHTSEAREYQGLSDSCINGHPGMPSQGRSESRRHPWGGTIPPRCGLIPQPGISGPDQRRMAISPSGAPIAILHISTVMLIAHFEGLAASLPLSGEGKGHRQPAAPPPTIHIWGVPPCRQTVAAINDHSGRPS